MIKRIKFRKAGTKELEESWVAPFAGEEAFIINDEYLIWGVDVHKFDAVEYKKTYRVLETWD